MGTGSEQLPPLYEEPKGTGWRVPLLIAALLGAGIVAAIFWLGRPTSETAGPPPPTALPPLDEESRAYAQQIEISSLEMSRWENFLGQQVIYLDGKLTNHGDRVIHALELTVEFKDQLDQVVLRERFRPVGAAPGSPTAGRTPPLPPGEVRDFRAGFESLPRDWNRRPPTVRVTGLLLQ